MQQARTPTYYRALTLFALIIAGEMIFSLPFHVARFFRPTVLEVFGLSNAALGDIFALYGVLAMIAYLPGGTVADHFSARKLLSLSLITTALGGLYMATIPGRMGMHLLFAFWGVTSILLFWAALIRATREWGGALAQGRAFGLLEGGRGLAAAVFATVAVWLFGLLLTPSPEIASDAERRYAMQTVIMFYSFITAMAAVLVWFCVPEADATHSSHYANPLRDVKAVIRRRVVWLQALVVICAYCGYKGLDNYGLYAVAALGMNEVEAARFTSIAAYLRPIAAIAAGFLADRIMASRTISILFLLMIISYTLLFLLTPTASMLHIIYANLICSFIAVYALRGVYFALLEETRIDYQFTGTAVGLISLIGFTPDIFFASIAGRVLDAAPGLEGQQNFFLLLTGFAAIGLVSAVALTMRAQNPHKG